ncbi:antimicrobial peptide 1 [Selaginella moellendorffii]|nr:antimicrobial peptide 1 [Selaginella moellendorffii]|eukprot:XP_002981961.2 antimicrobial peptide 1 [Selaginella moellendorffii]
MAGKMVLVLVAIAVVGSMITANASFFDAWAGPGCNNVLERYSACGCTNVRASQHGGYSFVYQGQTAAAYNTANCRGVAHTRFSRSVQDCSGFGWNSFFIQC